MNFNFFPWAESLKSKPWHYVLTRKVLKISINVHATGQLFFSGHLEIISDFLNFIASLFKHYLNYQLFTKHFKDFTIKGDKAYCLKISRLIKNKL